MFDIRDVRQDQEAVQADDNNPGPAVDPVLARAALFRGVEPGAVEALTRLSQWIEFARGRTVFVEGQQGDRLYIILSGKVKIGRRTADGRANLLAVLGPSEMFGELAVFDPGPRTSNATTITKVTAVAVDRDTFQAWTAERPEIAEVLLQVLARRLRRTNDTLSDLIFTDVPGRVATQLLNLARQFGTRDGAAIRVVHGLTQDEIAQLVGSARETVNKVLADFSRRGWIQVDGRSVVIMDPARLAGRART